MSHVGKEYHCSKIDYFPKDEYTPDPNDSTMAIPCKYAFHKMFNRPFSFIGMKAEDRTKNQMIVICVFLHVLKSIKI